MATMPFYRPPTKFAKVMFLHVSVILFTGGVSPGPYPGGRLRGLARGGLQAHTGGGGRLGVLAGGSPDPYLGRRLRGLAGGLQVHTQGGGWGSGWGVSRPSLGGGPGSGGVGCVYPSMH